eukprot:gene6520-7020_t
MVLLIVSVVTFVCLTFTHGLLNEKIHEIEHVAKVLRGNRTFLPFKEVPYRDMDQMMNNQSVFFTSFPLTLNQMGNRICWYFEAVACADIARHHLVMKIFNPTNISFFNRFERIFEHPNPAPSSEESASLFLKTCPKLFPYPFAFSGAWNQRPLLIRQLMNKALDEEFPHPDQMSIDIKSFHEKNDKASSISSPLPFIPDVAILFRCKDIHAFSWYGFIPFHVYNLLLKGKNVQTIYILSEPLDYLSERDSADAVSVGNCIHLSQGLVDHLSKLFPEARIAVRRGHAIESLMILARAKTVICAPSSFCLWPGIANPNEVYYFPSRVVMVQPFLFHNFKWVGYPPVRHLGMGLANDSYAHIWALDVLSSPGAFDQSKIDFQSSYAEPVLGVWSGR